MRLALHVQYTAVLSLGPSLHVVLEFNPLTSSALHKLTTLLRTPGLSSLDNRKYPAPRFVDEYCISIRANDVVEWGYSPRSSRDRLLEPAELFLLEPVK